jgi:hypothetical protein
MTQLQNVPTGWGAFRVFQQTPPPISERRHGNFRHGHYSKRGIEGMREVRLLGRIIRHGLWHLPLPGAPRRTPPGWSVYRAARKSRVRDQP